MNNNVKNIFQKGVKHFNNKEYYMAHELFEEIWTDHKVNDRLFIQALIQLSVAYFHISNINKNGAIGLFKKSIKKLDNYKNNSIIIFNINEVIDLAQRSFKAVNTIKDISTFDWSLAPELKINNEK